MDTPKIPGYRIRREIGSGGMATVYLALQENLHREVALKVMIPGLSADEIYCHRFLKEGRIAAQLSHQNLLTVYDIGVHQDEYYYMASEYLPGGTVRDKMSRGMDIEDILQVLFELGQGLDYAHAKGFVHRDIKPGNIFYRANGESVLGDFGIAKSVDSNTNATKLGTSIGTPHYMSPEQAKGDRVDHRTDLYSLGIVFYELLTGRPPFDADDPFTVALMQINEDPPPLPKTHAKFQGLIDKLLAKDRDKRFARAEEFLVALEEVSGERAPARATTRRRVSTNDVAEREAPKQAAADAPASTPAVQKKMSQQIRERTDRRSPLKLARLLAMVMLLIALGGTAYVGFQNDWLKTWLPDDAANNAPMPDAQLRERVESLLGQAAAQRSGGALFEPPGANAYETYQQVLRLDSENLRARAGVEGLADAARDAAAQALDAGDFGAARRMVSDALRRFPAAGSLRRMLTEIETAQSRPQDSGNEVSTSQPDRSAEEVAQILLRANRYLDGNEIIEAARDFQRVLELEPANAEAAAKLTRIADYWATAAERFIRLDNRERAAQMIEKGLEAKSDHPRLLALQEQLQ